MSEPQTSPQTRRVRICLSALTRVEYSEVLEVPVTMTRGDLDDLVERRYSDIDGTRFTEDMEFWEQGDCHWVSADPSDPVDGRVTTGPDGFEVEDLSTEG